MRYSDELLEEIRSRNDIIDVISQYVVLKRSGRNYFGLCPFHNEKSPSFSVSPDKQIFHCFGCGVGGNVFHFITKIENISFVESVQMLAERAGVNLPTIGNYEDEKVAKLKAKVYDVNNFSAEFYHQNLYKPTAKPGQEYIKKRKLDNNTLKAFKIGYSGEFDELYKALRKEGFEDEEILASGLVNKTKEGRYIDRYRHRVMFPIQDVRNRVIAFGGRVLDDSKPKYINSPENIVYSKGRNLFGLNVAKKSNPGIMKRLLIVEGYMDAISLYQRGITNVVASLGTALTDAQGRLLRKSTEQVILGYDSDGAGQAAIVRGMEILKNMGCDIRVLQISGAKDPDEFVIKYGPDRFKKCMDDAISVVEYKVKNLKKELNLENVSDKIKFLNALAKILSEVDNSMEREVYVEKIAKAYGISKEAIYAEINKKLYSNNGANSKILEARPNIIRPKQEEKIDEFSARREQMLIYLLINYPKESFERIKNVVSLESIKSEKNKNIISTLYQKLSTNESVEKILNWFEDAEIVNYITGILAYDFELTDINKGIEDIENVYKKNELVKRRDEIINKLNDKTISKEEAIELGKELNTIIIDLAKIK